jgi:hypothetical protein
MDLPPVKTLDATPGARIDQLLSAHEAGNFNRGLTGFELIFWQYQDRTQGNRRVRAVKHGRRQAKCPKIQHFRLTTSNA